MMTPVTLWRSLLATVVTALLANPCLAGNLTIKDAPQWVNTGTTYETMQGNRVFHGVGLAPVMGDEALQKSVAKGRARRELQRILTTYLNDLASQYKTTASSDTTSASGDKAAGQLIMLGKPALQQARVVARWHDKRTGTLYTLLQLDLNAVKRIAEQKNDISPATKQFIQEYGDIVFDSESQYVEY